MKPGDIRIGIGNGSSGGVPFLVLEVPPDELSNRWSGAFVKVLTGGIVKYEPLDWLKLKTASLEDTVETR